MKVKIYSIIILCVVVLTGNAQDFKNAISTNSNGIIASYAGAEIYRNNINYERKIHDDFSLLFDIERGRYMTGESFDNGGYSDQIEQKGYGFTLEGRVYPTKKHTSPYGLFLGLFYKHYFVNEVLSGGYNGNMETIVDENHTVSGIGIDIGYKFDIQRFMIEPLLGYAAGSDSGLGTNDEIDGFYKTVSLWPYFLRLECKIGLLF